MIKNAIEEKIITTKTKKKTAAATTAVTTKGEFIPWLGLTCARFYFIFIFVCVSFLFLRQCWLLFVVLLSSNVAFFFSFLIFFCSFFCCVFKMLLRFETVQSCAFSCRFNCCSAIVQRIHHLFSCIVRVVTVARIAQCTLRCLLSFYLSFLILSLSLFHRPSGFFSFFINAF